MGIAINFVVQLLKMKKILLAFFLLALVVGTYSCSSSRKTGCPMSAKFVH
jgi:hypothetical protein